MADADPAPTVQVWLDRLKGGDEAARAALLERACNRLARITRKMLRGYPGVGRWEQPDDILQNALIRLDRALRANVPATAGDFFRLAATLIRRELIDLARHYQGPEGLGAHHSTCAGRDPSDGAGPGPGDPAQSTYDPGRLALWTEFHRQIQELDPGDRELFDLLWYQGLTQAEAADILGVAERTIGRRWVAARMNLHRALGGRLPDL